MYFTLLVLGVVYFARFGYSFLSLVLSVLFSLGRAVCLSRMGQFSKACSFFADFIVGNEHMVTLDVLYNYSKALVASGNAKRGEEILREVGQTFFRVLVKLFLEF